MSSLAALTAFLAPYPGRERHLAWPDVGLGRPAAIRGAGL